jgi:hypothetical protein
MTNEITLQDLLEQSQSYDELKNEYVAKVADLAFDEQARMLVPADLFNLPVALPMTDWALRQVCDKLGPPPYGYMRDCPQDLRSENLNYWRERGNGKSWFIREYKGHARGVLTPEYAKINNTEVLEMIAELMVNTPHWLIRPWVDPDALHLKIAMAATEDGNYAIGAYVSNGEIGNLMVRVLPFIQRHSCENSILYVEGGFTQRHYRVTPAFIFGALKEKIGQALGLASDMLNQVVRAEAEKIPDIAKMVEAVCKQHGLSQPVHDAILMGTERAKTRMGLVNGLSFAAHQFDDIEMAIRLESMAGAVLAGNNPLKLKSYVEE